MSVLWTAERGADRYEVRRAGRSVRLYSNGVFHSQWNPARPLSGSVWDLLALPVFYLRTPCPRVLVLGVGGGAVIRQLGVLKPGVDIVGVERDPVHITVAAQWFGVGGADQRLSLADAVAWLKHYRGEPFDYIVDDLFGHVNGEAARAVVADRQWGRTLARHLSPNGVLVVNHAALSEWRLNALRAAGFCYRRKATLPLYDNVVGTYSREPLDPNCWQERLNACSALTAAQRALALSGQPV